MNTARTALAGVLAALFTVLGATAAQAYPDPTVKITVGDARFVGGLPLDYTADSGGVECAWTVTFNGKSQVGSGTSFSGTFSTPKVDKVTKKTITARCAYDASGASAAAVASDSATVTLLPEGTDDDGDTTTDNGALPDTGGSNLWILIVGGVLVVIGGGAVVASRRQS